MINFTRGHLIFGLICTWIVGMGRYWDNPKAEWLQHLGIGSVVYIFVLSFFLLLFVAPLRVSNASYFRVLTFVSLVSPPAVLYAIPVEKFVDMESANTINAWFLLIVATWRVALWIFAMRRLFDVGWIASITATLLPLTIIVVALLNLNLEKVVFEIMGGFHKPTPNDSAYVVLFLITLFSMMLAPVLIIVYSIFVYQAHKKKARSATNDLIDPQKAELNDIDRLLYLLAEFAEFEGLSDQLKIDGQNLRDALFW